MGKHHGFPLLEVGAVEVGQPLVLLQLQLLHPQVLLVLVLQLVVELVLVLQLVQPASP